MSDIIFDIDQTLVYKDSPYHCDRSPIPAMVEHVNMLKNAGHTIILATARDEVIRDCTEAQLAEHGIPYDALYMMPEYVPGTDKVPLLLQIFEDGYNPILAYEDRQRTIDAWQEHGVKMVKIDAEDFKDW